MRILLSFFFASLLPLPTSLTTISFFSPQRCQVFGTARVLARCSAWLRATLSIDVQCERVEVDSDAEALAAVGGGDALQGGAATRIAVISVVADAPPAALGSALFPALAIELVAGCHARERLVVLAKSYGMRSAFDKTALSFDLDGSHPGDLSRALRAFQVGAHMSCTADISCESATHLHFDLRSCSCSCSCSRPTNISLPLASAGELILFTVSFCANPANDLTCPPSYIII